MKNLFIGLLLLSLMCLLSACSPKAEVAPSQNEAETLTTQAEAEISREAVYTYPNQSINFPPKIVLRLQDEPLLVGAVYIRLTGVVMGSKKWALIDLAGSSMTVEEGQVLHDYRVTRIRDNAVAMEKM